MNDKKNLNGIKRNFSIQYYEGIPLKQIDRGYGNAKARRFTVNGTNQNVWIPCKHLEIDGTIKNGEQIDYVFAQSKRQLELAGVKIVYQVEKVGY